MQNNAAVLFSGGLDSAVLVKAAMKTYHEVCALSFYYGQGNQVELEFAEVACHEMGCYMHEVLDIGDLRDLFGPNALTDKSVVLPTGPPDAPTMHTTIVPGRNLIMLSIASAFGQAHDFGKILYGANRDDAAVYPDCRPDFIDSAAEVLSRSSNGRIELHAPFRDSSKADIVRLGAELNVPFNLTYSCYAGMEDHERKPYHCGRCGACQGRRQAFVDAGVPDPTEWT